MTTYTFSELFTFTRSTTATFVGSNGLIQTAAINAPRFDYDPATLQPKGILIEEQRVNLRSYSDQFDNAVYAKTGVLAFGSGSIVNATASPDGTINADLLTENTSNSRHGFDTTFTSISAGNYTFSIFVKSNGRSALDFVAYGSGMTTRTITGVAITSGANFGNGWYRVSWTFDVSAPPTSLVIECWMNNGTSGTYTGNGTSGMFYYGAQLEAGAFATSYIPTVASQVTRAADQCSIVAPLFAPWYNQSEGTLVAQFTGTGSYAVAVNDGGNDNAVGITRNGTTLVRGLTITAGVFRGVDTTAAAAGTVNKTAYAFKANDLAISNNGGAVATNATSGIPTVTRLVVGTYSSFGHLNGHIRSIQYYPVRLADFQLQALTA